MGKEKKFIQKLFLEGRSRAFMDHPVTQGAIFIATAPLPLDEVFRYGGKVISLANKVKAPKLKTDLLKKFGNYLSKLKNAKNLRKRLRLSKSEKALFDEIGQLIDDNAQLERAMKWTKSQGVNVDDLMGDKLVNDLKIGQVMKE